MVHWQGNHAHKLEMLAVLSAMSIQAIPWLLNEVMHSLRSDLTSQVTVGSQNLGECSHLDVEVVHGPELAQLSLAVNYANLKGFAVGTKSGTALAGETDSVYLIAATR